jgi:hypothetical protein
MDDNLEVGFQDIMIRRRFTAGWPRGPGEERARMFQFEEDRLPAVIK